MIDQISTQAEIQDWIAANDFDRLQKKILDSETDEFRYKILVALLLNEMTDFALETVEGDPIP
jgi:hypothetical protein